MRTLVIGDVHGCRAELEALLEAIAFDPAGDRLVLVGDVVAKGPDSAGAVRVAREGGAEAVCGNHDARCLGWFRALRAGEAPPKLGPAHRKACHELEAEDWAWLDAQPALRRYDDAVPERDLLVVHGGLDPYRDPEELAAEAPDLVMNARSLSTEGVLTKRIEGMPWGAAWPGPELVVYGHDAVRGLQRHPHAFGLDTGCVYGGQLTAAVFEGEHAPRLVHVPAERVHCAPRVA